MDWFKNLKISVKLMSGFIIVAMIACIVGIIGMSNLNKVNDLDTEMYQVNTVPTGNLAKMIEYYHRIRANLRDEVINKDKQYRLDTQNKILDREKTLLESLTNFGESVGSSNEDPEIAKNYDALKTLLEGRYKQYQDSVISLVLADRDDEAIALIYDDGDKLNTEIQGYLDNLLNAKISDAKIKSDGNTKTANNTFLLMVIIISAGVILALGLGIIVSRSIGKPVGRLVQVANSLMAGDVAVKIGATTRDEIGKLGNAFGRLVEVLNNLIHEADGVNRATSEGRLQARGDAGKFEGGYRQIIEGLNKTLDALVGHIDVLPAPILIIDKEFGIRYINKTGAGLTGMTQNQLLGMKCYDLFKTSDCQTQNCACCQAMQLDRKSTRETVAHLVGKDVDISYSGVPLKDENGKVIGCYEIITDQTDIKKASRVAMKQAEYQEKEVGKLLKNLERLANGQLYCECSVEAGDEDTRMIRDNFLKINENLQNSIDTIKSYIGEVSRVLGEMSGGNLDVGITGEYKGDFIEIKNSLNMIVESFNEVFEEINAAADQVANGSQQVSASSMALSQGATEQASAIEELTASLEEISAQTKLNAENANEANSIAESSKANALQGNGQMNEMLKAMDEINTASGNISKIIKVIDEIAFQTNILALNAAVEAARAGQHGKGFAVVAEEVRNLAARSANAAKETTEMIEGSIKKADYGRKIANQTADALTRIVEGISKVARIVNDIASASNEQATGIAQINQGVIQVSQVVQTNSATSQESAASSEELAGQAEFLKDQISKFSLRGARRQEISSLSRKEALFRQERSVVIDRSPNAKPNELLEPEVKTKKPLAPKKSQNGKNRISMTDVEFGKY